MEDRNREKRKQWDRGRGRIETGRIETGRKGSRGIEGEEG